MIELIAVRIDNPDTYEGFEDERDQAHLMEALKEAEVFNGLQKHERKPEKVNFEQQNLYNIRLKTDFRFDPVGYVGFSINQSLQSATLTTLNLLGKPLHRVYEQELVAEIEKELSGQGIRHIEADLADLDAQTINFLKRLGFQEIGRKFTKKL